MQPVLDMASPSALTKLSKTNCDNGDKNDNQTEQENNNQEDSQDTDPACLDAEKAEYLAFARGQYQDLFEELEFRCQRAAMMHYHEANYYSRRCFYLELAAAILGAASVSSLGIFLLKRTDTSEIVPSCLTSRLGALGLFGVAVSGMLEFAAKGSSRLVPTLCKRASAHKEAAVGWRKLTHLTRSSRIRLQNPCVSVDAVAKWYTDLVQEKQTISALALVPSTTYRSFNDPGQVYAANRRKRMMFLTYQQMVKGKEKVDDVYDDDYVL